MQPPGTGADERDELRELVQTQLGRVASGVRPIEAGLGARRFYRIEFDEGTPRSLIARVDRDPPQHPLPRSASPATRPAIRPSTRPLGQTLAADPPVWLPEPPLEPLRSFLAEAGLPVPGCHAHLPDRGIDLLEDVGDHRLGDADGSKRPALYREACALVPRLQRLSATPARIPAFGRVFDRALVETKAWKWLHWAIPGLLGREASAAESRATRAVFARIATLLEAAPRRLAHRDFKAENLHRVCEPPANDEHLVMIDIQGAFMAPPEYDLVCLLYDLQVDLSEDFVQQAFRTIQPLLPDDTPLAIASTRFDSIATIRLCKDVAHVVHAGRERHDFRRWHEIPRGLELLTRAAGRLRHTLPEIEALISVIHTLSDTCKSSDSGSRGHAN